LACNREEHSSLDDAFARRGYWLGQFGTEADLKPLKGKKILADAPRHKIGVPRRGDPNDTRSHHGESTPARASKKR